MMKTIEIIPTVYHIKCLYRDAVTKYQRELLGYMIQTGRTDNPMLGGAFRLLFELDSVPKEEMYTLTWENKENAMEIIAVAEAVRARVFRKFAISKWKVKRINKNISNVLDDQIRS